MFRSCSCCDPLGFVAHSRFLRRRRGAVDDIGVALVQEEEEEVLEVAVEVEVENAHPPFSHSPWALSGPLSQH